MNTLEVGRHHEMLIPIAEPIRDALGGYAEFANVASSTLTQRWRNRLWLRTGLPSTVASHVRCVSTFVIVTLTFVLFRADTVRDALLMYGKFLSARMGELTLPVGWPLAMIAAVVCGDVIAAQGWDVDRIHSLPNGSEA